MFIALEKEIKDALPQFQELLLTLKSVRRHFWKPWYWCSRCSHDGHPTKEASAARKRLLEAFAQYDALAKKIKQLPCPNGPASSQARIQAAILMRANLFLQKNMFPLQVSFSSFLYHSNRLIMHNSLYPALHNPKIRVQQE